MVTMLVALLSGFAISATASERTDAESLSTPVNLVLNRGHIETLAFGGPMGLSWTEVENSDSYTVFVFEDESTYNPDEAFAYVEDIDALYLDVNIEFSDKLSEGQFWFRVQAVADDIPSSALSNAIGPFTYSFHSDEFADNPEGSYAVFANPDIPVIVIDTRRPAERDDQGHVVGDIHVPWPNAVAVEEGITTHADFQRNVLAAWHNFIENDLTDTQRENLDPDMSYKDIHIFIY